jgi:hypothetical protein
MTKYSNLDDVILRKNNCSPDQGNQRVTFFNLTLKFVSTGIRSEECYSNHLNNTVHAQICYCLNLQVFWYVLHNLNCSNIFTHVTLAPSNRVWGRVKHSLAL